MKIYFNRRPVTGPWGGGSKILSSIVDECVIRGHQILFDNEIKLRKDIDAIFCIDPRPSQHTSFKDLIDYKEKFGTKLIQRIGDLGTHGKPELFNLIKNSAIFADVVIYPSNWAKNYLNQQHNKSYVIKNAPLPEFVEKNKNYQKSFSGIINLVTHHWSDNLNKGFDIYQQLNDYCLESKKFNFTYIGRKPSNVNFDKHLLPMDVSGLINELPNHHIYVTASKMEAGANHVLEAMAMNLPVLYHEEGGSINEYCNQNGLSYSNFDELKNILENYVSTLHSIFIRMSETRNTKDMTKEYVDLIESIT